MGHRGSKSPELEASARDHTGHHRHGVSTPPPQCSCDCPEAHAHGQQPAKPGSPSPAPSPGADQNGGALQGPRKDLVPNGPSEAELKKYEQKVLGEMNELLQHQGRREDYHMGKVLGKGHFAVVRKCTCVKTGKEYAVKILSIDTLVNRESLISELKILRQVKPHPNVVNLIDYFYSDHHFYMVVDLCLGGDLFAQITTHGKFTEHRAAVIATQVAAAIMHLHACGVIHRDIKPENVLLVSPDVDSPVKVGDFGLSRLVNSELTVMRTICGTWAYSAPEVIVGQPYTGKVDNWSFGVLLYTLISGYQPFDPYADLPQKEMLQRVACCRYDFNDPIWKPVSKSAIALVESLIKMDPHDRLDFPLVLQSAWMNDQVLPTEVRAEVLQNMRRLHDRRLKFKSLVFAKMASHHLKEMLHHRHSSSHQDLASISPPISPPLSAHPEEQQPSAAPPI